MEKWPCDPDRRDTDRCPIYRKLGKCFLDVHHKYYPRVWYTRPHERKFRNLEVNKVLACRALHDDFHATNHPPVKPWKERMIEALEDVE